MRNDGRSLEELVEFVERSLAQDGFDVEVNKKLFDENGTQLAEFDVVVTGKFGSTNISWLIECRDRPSAGAAAGEWIQQLASRRTLFNFHKVTAVSTTGFSPSAIHAAQKFDIELREVASMSAEDLLTWLMAKEVELVQHNVRLSDLQVVLDKREMDSSKQAVVDQFLAAPDGREKMVLINSATGESGGIFQAFREALDVAGAFNDLNPAGPPVPVEMEVAYGAADGGLLLRTPVGDICIKRIKYFGHIEAPLTRHPIKGHSEYRNLGDSKSIAQTAYSKIPLPTGEILTFEFKKLNDQDQLHLSWKVSNQSKD